MRKRGWQMLAAWAGGNASMAYTNKVIALSPIAYWPLADASGTTATDESGNNLSGTYSNVTLGQTGIGDGRTAALFVPASSSFVNVNSAGLSTAFGTGQEGTYSLWAKVANSGVWSDATNRWIFRIDRNTTNDIVDLVKRNVTGQLDANYKAGGTTKVVSPTGQNSTGWLHFAMTWSKSADQMMVYVNGAQFGTTQTGLGTWEAGTFVTAVIGAQTSGGASAYSGFIAHVALFASALSAAQIASLATVP